MINWLNFLVLTVTLFVLCVYAWDTKKMQRASTKQLELGIKPLLSIDPIYNPGKLLFRITNIGNGTALNIEFNPIVFGSGFADLEFHLPFIQGLRSGEARDLEVISMFEGEEADHSWTAHLHPDYANGVLLLTLQYVNIDFEESKQLFEFGLGDKKIRMLQSDGIKKQTQRSFKFWK